MYAPDINLKKSISMLAMFSVMHFAYVHEVKIETVEWVPSSLNTEEAAHRKGNFNFSQRSY